MRMKGLSFASIKKNPALLPLYFFIGVAATGATVFTLRMAFHATDVSWVNKKDAEPWNYYKDKPYKVPNEIIRLNYFKSTLDDL